MLKAIPQIFICPAGQQELRIDLKLPAGVEALSDWSWPEPETVWDGGEIQIYSGKQIFRRKLKIAGASGDITLVAAVSYQACTATMCAPPQTVEVTTTLKPVRK
ncbi:protein-disulfide reductase DsbD domain-containing protein [Oleiharenicola lentus]|uniref:protein-disulfide reductase DsbD domain-containing protein n=1 Tax=Oleiharenicola lentus TaxID=2508720 RepID=UPI003F672ED8